MTAFRKHIRLKHYDYRQNGFYFITVCTENRKHLLADHSLEQLVAAELALLPKRFPGLSIDYHIFMPDHLHVIFAMDGCKSSLSEIVQAFKSVTTLRAKQALPLQVTRRLWQPNYYEHVIRTEKALENIRQYIENNPLAEQIDWERIYHSTGKIGKASFAATGILMGLLSFWNPVFAAEDLTAGKAIYEKRCAQCHGMTGKGDGPAASFVDPRPRDFTMGQYKFRTTQSGELPTDDDLLKVVAEGIPGTSMTPFGELLTPDERDQVVAYVKSFYPGFSGAKPQLFRFGKALTGDAEKGKELFQKMMCFSCHGNAGRGNGASAFTLKDASGNQIFPANLHQNWTFRGGGTVEEIYRRLMTGLNGTPMPSYSDALESEEDRWALARYVHSLSRPPNLSSVISAIFVDGTLPTDPKDKAWDRAAFVDIPLSGQIVLEPRLFKPSINQVSVKALYSKDTISFLIYWDDRTNSLSSGATQYNDAVALQFPARKSLGQEKPYFLGGDSQHPVNLWFWQNGSSAREYNAMSFSTWTVQADADQSLQAPGAVFDDGRWWLVVSRSLTTGSPETDVQFAVGEFAPVAFFVWDGSNGENKERCAISTWYDVGLVPQTPVQAYAFPPIAVLVVGGLQWWFVRKMKRRRNAGV